VENDEDKEERRRERNVSADRRDHVPAGERIGLAESCRGAARNSYGKLASRVLASQRRRAASSSRAAAVGVAGRDLAK
jgi:hypothetical protein